uniref:transposase family protein n=1 Tax=Okeania sp. SIO2F4 TaxID=2607790 RepID=UPI0025E13438|nr:transposase family protein [Okeania sp. SIO2F4]
MVDVVAGKPGPKSGVKLFRESQKGLSQNQKFNGDRADEGELSIKTPHKKPKKQELTPEQKERNRELATDANFCCTLNSWTVKIFRVAQERFRLNSSKYEQIIMIICRLVRLGICTFIL